MNLIATVIKPDADGTLHLPLPKAWQNQSIRVRAELEPVGVEKEPGSGGAWENLKGFGCLHGRISLAPDFDEPLEDFEDYVITLPQHHSDPFDRLIIAQAQVEGLTVVTRDENFPAYGVPLLW